VTKHKVCMCDTNYIIRYLMQDEPQLYQYAKEFFDDVYSAKKNAHIIESVLVECVYVLDKYYSVPRTEIGKTLESLLNYKGIICDNKEDIIKALDIYQSSNLDIVDCILVARCAVQNSSLRSFDKAMMKKHSSMRR